MKTLERRSCTRPIEVREAPDGSINVRGYASVFDQEAYGEVVKSTAFNRTLAQRDDVRLLVNHEGVPLARTKSGTLNLSVDSTGLLIEAAGLDPANPDVQRLRSAMARGDLDQMSFGFEATDDPQVDGVRELREVKLFDVSIVTYPWYDQTSVEMNERQWIAGMSAERRARFIEAFRDGILTPDEVQAIEDAEPVPVDEPEVEAEAPEAPPEAASAPLTVAEARALLGLPEAA